MSETALLLLLGFKPVPVDPRLLELKRMRFLFAAGRPLTRALLMDWRAGMEQLAASTINVRLSAMPKLVTEARRNGATACSGQKRQRG